MLGRENTASKIESSFKREIEQYNQQVEENRHVPSWIKLQCEISGLIVAQESLPWQFITSGFDILMMIFTGEFVIQLSSR